MKNLLNIGRGRHEPILSPLGGGGVTQRVRGWMGQLPPAAAPIAVTLVGGLGLVIFLAALLGGQQPQEAPFEMTAAEELIINSQADERPEEPAMLTAQDAPPSVSLMPATLETVQPLQQPDPQTQARFPENAPDPAQTASILSAAPTPGALRPSVEVAETDEEIAALEAIQRREVEVDVGASQAQPAALATSTDTMRVATASNYVNLRAGPSDDAEVLMVVPANARIEAESDCDWCAVAYDGRTGYIYRTFITYE